MKRIPRLVALTGLLVVGYSSAQTDYNKTVQQLGTEVISGPQSRAYFSVKEGFSQSCAYGLVYFDLSMEWAKSAYATLLAARSADRKLSRIDYSQPGGVGTQCNLTLLEVAD